MSTYTEELEPPIPIGRQKYAYQCENFVIEPLSGSANIIAWPPRGGGKEPYPNPEGDKIKTYHLKIERFTSNSMTIDLIKKFKDGSEIHYQTTVSFSDLANRLFTGSPANVFSHEPPPQKF